MPTSPVGKKNSEAQAFHLEIQNGSEKGRRIQLTTKPIRIGRDDTSDLYLRDVEVSRVHAEIRFVGNGFEIVDLRSSNGVFVDERKTKHHKLLPGNLIRLGQTEIQFSLGSTDSVVHHLNPDEVSEIDLRDSDQSLAQIVNTMNAQSAVPGFSEAPELSSSSIQSLNYDDVIKSGHQDAPDESRFLSVLFQLLDSTNSVTDLEEILKKVLDCIIETAPAERGCVFILDADSNEITKMVCRRQNGSDSSGRITINKSVLDRVKNDREGIIVSGISSNTNLLDHSEAEAGQPRQAICVPMISRKNLIGVIYFDSLIDSASPDSHYSEYQLHLSLVIAHYAAIVVENSQYQSALIKAERNATIGRVTESLARHSRTILNGINGGAGLIEDGIRKDSMENVNDGWQIVGKYKNRINELILNMLAISKPESPKFEIGNVNQIVEETLETHGRNLQENNVFVDWVPTKDLPAAKFDLRSMCHALQNIIVNAIEACRKQNSARISIRSVHDTNNNLVRIVVIDNGLGIQTENINSVFDLFESFGDRGPGLGLTVARQILRMHGGEVECYSQPEKGSQFDLVLPVEPTKSGDTVRE